MESYDDEYWERRVQQTPRKLVYCNHEDPFVRGDQNGQPDLSTVYQWFQNGVVRIVDKKTGQASGDVVTVEPNEDIFLFSADPLK